MRVTYSIGARFAGGGIGNTAYHAANGLYRAGLLYRLVCGSHHATNIPEEQIFDLGLASRSLRRLAVSDPTRYLTYFHNLLYDRWSARHVEKCTLFHFWNGFGLAAQARAQEYGAITVVDRASSHPLYQQRLLQEEYRHWGLDFKQPTGMLQRAVQEIESADFVLIPSDFVRRSFEKVGAATDKLLQISFGVDLEKFRQAEFPIPDSPFRVLFVGQISFQKGVPYLLEAWRKLRWRNAELWLLGRVEKRFIPILDRYSDMENVRIPGHVPDVASRYRRAHLFVFPTIQEGSALVVYEAMASGLPVITTPNAGSIIRDNVDGCIVEIRKAKLLAEKMQLLRDQPARRKALGQAARRRVESYPWERYGDEIASTYRALLEGLFH